VSRPAPVREEAGLVLWFCLCLGVCGGMVGQSWKPECVWGMVRMGQLLEGDRFAAWLGWCYQQGGDVPIGGGEGHRRSRGEVECC
jgi:hypothetical protein